MKIFRRFRINSIISKRVKNYFIYALGEIILVMIGILLALQVNNLNEQRKNRDKEQQVYFNLSSVLRQDLDHVNLKMENLERSIEAIELFILHDADSLLAKYPMDSINTFINNAWRVSSSFMPNKAYYNKLLNTNQLDLVQSDELRSHIIKLYEHYYVRYNDLDLNIEEMLVFSMTTNYYSLVIDSEIRNGQITLDRARFLQHYGILNKECRNIYNLAITIYGAMNNCKVYIEYLLTEIEKEQVKSEK